MNQSTDNNYKESSKDQKAKSLFLRPKHAAVILCAVPSRYSRIEMDAREFEDCQPEFGLNEARRVEIETEEEVEVENTVEEFVTDDLR